MIDPTNTLYNLENLHFRNLVRHTLAQESEIAVVMVWIGIVLLIGGSVIAFTKLSDWILRGSKSSK